MYCSVQHGLPRHVHNNFLGNLESRGIGVYCYQTMAPIDYDILTIDSYTEYNWGVISLLYCNVDGMRMLNTIQGITIHKTCTVKTSLNF